jgi:hypothetical protein
MGEREIHTYKTNYIEKIYVCVSIGRGGVGEGVVTEEGRALRAYVSSTRICMVRQRWWLIVRGSRLCSLLRISIRRNSHVSP